MSSPEVSAHTINFTKKVHKIPQNNHCDVLIVLNCPTTWEASELISSTDFKNAFPKCVVFRLQIDSKIEGNHADKLKSHEFAPDDRMVVSYESQVDNRCIIHWKNADTEEFLTLDLLDEKFSGEICGFAVDFIVGALMNGKDVGSMTTSVHLTTIFDSQSHNFLFAAARQNNFGVVRELLAFPFDVNEVFYLPSEGYDEEEQKPLRIVDCAYENKNEELLLHLLNANSMYPAHFDVNDTSEEVEDFLEVSENLHKAIKRKNVEKIAKIIGKHKHLRYFFNRDNVSAAKQALASKSFEIYKILVDHGLSFAPDESIDECLHELTTELKQDITRVHTDLANYLPDHHITVLMSRTVTPHGTTPNSTHKELIREALATLNSIEETRLLLQVAATSRRLKVHFDFTQEQTVQHMELTTRVGTRGLTAASVHHIYIAAKGLLSFATRLDVIAIFAHELCHFVVHLVFRNRRRPFAVGDTVDESEFNSIVDECEERRSEEWLIDLVYDNESHSARVRELIVRVPHMLVQYMDDRAKLAELEETFRELYDYFKHTVVPAMRRALPVLGRHEVEFEGLTFELKSAVAHSTVDFQGTRVKLIEIVGDLQSTVLRSLTPKQIRQLLNCEPLKISEIHASTTRFYHERCLISEYLISPKLFSVDKRTAKRIYSAIALDNMKTFEDVSVEVGKTKMLLLADHAGEGKSTTFMHMGLRFKKAFRGCWVSYIDLKEFLGVYQEFFGMFEGKDVGLRHVDCLDCKKNFDKMTEIDAGDGSLGSNGKLNEVVDETFRIEDSNEVMNESLSNNNEINENIENSLELARKLEELKEFREFDQKGTKIDGKSTEQLQSSLEKCKTIPNKTEIGRNYESDTLKTGILNDSSENDKRLETTQNFIEIDQKGVKVDEKSTKQLQNSLKECKTSESFPNKTEIDGNYETDTNLERKNIDHNNNDTLKTEDSNGILNGSLQNDERLETTQNFNENDQKLIKLNENLTEEHQNSLKECKTNETFPKHTKIPKNGKDKEHSKTYSHKSMKIAQKPTKNPNKNTTTKSQPQFCQTCRNLHKTDEILSLLLKILKPQSSLDSSVFTTLFKSNQVIFLFDAVDEIAPNFKEFFLNLIDAIRRVSDNWQLIATRMQHVGEIRQKFKLMPYRLLPYDDEQCDEFIAKVLAVKLEARNLSTAQLNQQVDEVKKHRVNFSFFKNSLMLRLMAELQADGKLAAVESNRYAIYQAIVESKMDIVAAEKRAIANRDSLIESEMSLWLVFQVFGLKLVFKDELIEDFLHAFGYMSEGRKFMRLSEFSLFKVWKRAKNDWSPDAIARSGFLFVDNWNTPEETPSFTHRTFAEFFIAKFVIANIKLVFNFDSDLGEEEFERILRFLIFFLFDFFRKKSLYQVINNFIFDYLKTHQFLFKITPRILNFIRRNDTKRLLKRMLRKTNFNAHYFSLIEQHRDCDDIVRALMLADGQQMTVFQILFMNKIYLVENHFVRILDLFRILKGSKFVNWHVLTGYGAEFYGSVEGELEGGEFSMGSDKSLEKVDEFHENLPKSDEVLSSSWLRLLGNDESLELDRNLTKIDESSSEIDRKSSDTDENSSISERTLPFDNKLLKSSESSSEYKEISSKIGLELPAINKMSESAKILAKFNKNSSDIDEISSKIGLSLSEINKKSEIDKSLLEIDEISLESERTFPPVSKLLKSSESSSEDKEISLNIDLYLSEINKTPRSPKNLPKIEENLSKLSEISSKANEILSESERTLPLVNKLLKPSKSSSELDEISSESRQTLLEVDKQLRSDKNSSERDKKLSNSSKTLLKFVKNSSEAESCENHHKNLPESKSPNSSQKSNKNPQKTFIKFTPDSQLDHLTSFPSFRASDFSPSQISNNCKNLFHLLTFIAQVKSIPFSHIRDFFGYFLSKVFNYVLLSRELVDKYFEVAAAHFCDRKSEFVTLTTKELNSTRCFTPFVHFGPHYSDILCHFFGKLEVFLDHSEELLRDALRLNSVALQNVTALRQLYEKYFSDSEIREFLALNWRSEVVDELETDTSADFELLFSNCKVLNKILDFIGEHARLNEDNFYALEGIPKISSFSKEELEELTNEAFPVNRKSKYRYFPERFRFRNLHLLLNFLRVSEKFTASEVERFLSNNLSQILESAFRSRSISVQLFEILKSNFTPVTEALVGILQSALSRVFFSDDQSVESEREFVCYSDMANFDRFWVRLENFLSRDRSAMRRVLNINETCKRHTLIYTLNFKQKEAKRIYLKYCDSEELQRTAVANAFQSINFNVILYHHAFMNFFSSIYTLRYKLRFHVNHSYDVERVAVGELNNAFKAAEKFSKTVFEILNFVAQIELSEVEVVEFLEGTVRVIFPAMFRCRVIVERIFEIFKKYFSGRKKFVVSLISREFDSCEFTDISNDLITPECSAVIEAFWLSLEEFVDCDEELMRSVLLLYEYEKNHPTMIGKYSEMGSLKNLFLKYCTRDEISLVLSRMEKGLKYNQ